MAVGDPRRPEVEERKTNARIYAPKGEVRRRREWENGRRGWTQGCLSVLMRLKTSRFQATPRHESPAETHAGGGPPGKAHLTNGSALLLQLCDLAALSCGAPQTADWRRVSQPTSRVLSPASTPGSGQRANYGTFSPGHDRKRATIQSLVCPLHISLPVMSCQHVVLLIIDTRF
jgi:hypothetical protein